MCCFPPEVCWFPGERSPVRWSRSCFAGRWVCCRLRPAPPRTRWPCLFSDRLLDRCLCVEADRQTRRQALTPGRPTKRKSSHVQVPLSSHNMFNFVLVAQFRIVSGSPFLTYFGPFCKYTSLTQWFPKQENLSSFCSFFSNGNKRC